MTSQPSLITQVHDLVDSLVFGNGWLAFGALAAVAVLVVAVRTLPPVRV